MLIPIILGLSLIFICFLCLNSTVSRSPRLDCPPRFDSSKAHSLLGDPRGRRQLEREERALPY